jgi:NlpC/P60 family putative phage cell wall peptidase
MRDPAEPARVIAAARGWIGTPYVPRAALRGTGCDCIGLALGVWAEITGAPAPAPPPWSADWAAAWSRPLFALARSILIEIAPSAARPGDLVAIRRTDGRAAHVGILAPAGGFIHATGTHGVREVPLAGWSPRLAFAARFPLSP